MKDSISRLSKRLGVSVHTIRHYKDLQLISPQARENGYFEYDLENALYLMMIRQMRSMELSLDEIAHTFQKNSITEFMHQLDCKEKDLNDQLARIQYEIDRLNEIKQYTGFGIGMINGVNEFNGADIYSIPIAQAHEQGLPPNEKTGLIQKWADHYPFTYISISIPVQELEDEHFQGCYSTALGIGTTTKHFHRLGLPANRYVSFTPGGLCLRTCIAVPDIFAITPHDLGHFIDYAASGGYSFCHDTSGRLLFIEHEGERPLYYLLIWARVEKRRVNEH